MTYTKGASVIPKNPRDPSSVRPDVIVGGRYRNSRETVFVEKVDADSIWYRSCEGHVTGLCCIDNFLQEFKLVYDPLPDLLEACLKVLSCGCGCHSSDDPNWHSTRCFIPQVRAAIAKAEGRL
jgi:hypothetical protein